MDNAKDFIMTQDLYGPPTPALYGPPPEKIAIQTGRITFLIVLFIIGLVVVLNKKITKKTKIIVISVLTAVAALGLVLLEYLKTILE